MTGQGEPLRTNVADLDDFLGFLVLAAPASWRKLDLESAFQLLGGSVEACRAELGDPIHVAEIKANIAQALEAYRRGDSVKGSNILQLILHFTTEQRRSLPPTG